MAMSYSDLSRVSNWLRRWRVAACAVVIAMFLAGPAVVPQVVGRWASLLVLIVFFGVPVAGGVAARFRDARRDVDAKLEDAVQADEQRTVPREQRAARWRA